MTDSRENTWAYPAAFPVLAAYGSFGVFVRWTGHAGDEHAIVFWRVLFGCFFGLVVMFPFLVTDPVRISSKGWASLLVLGFFHSGVLALAYVYLAKKVKARPLGVISYIDPVASTLFAFAPLGEKPGWQTLVGGPLIIVAGLIVFFRGGVSGKGLTDE